MADTTQARGYGSLAAFRQSIYFLGGGDHTNSYDVVTRWDELTNQWTTTTPMRLPRGSFAALALGERVYAFGGGNTMKQDIYDTMDVYDPSTDTWMQGQSMRSKRFGVGGAVVEGSIFAVGGFDQKMYLDTVERFDPREGTWKPVQSMSVRRGSLLTSSLDGRIYALGGYNGSKIIPDAEVYEHRAGRWRIISPMQNQRAYGGAVGTNNSVFVIGGLEGPFDKLEKYSVQTDTWSTLEPPEEYKEACGRAFVCVTLLK